jgi:hypothetical protein
MLYHTSRDYGENFILPLGIQSLTDRAAIRRVRQVGLVHWNRKILPYY